MRRIVASEYVSLDGVMESPERWFLKFWNDEMARYAHDQLFASDALLLGRVTYEGFAASWPSMKNEGDFADRMNSLPKFVASTTLEETEWNATLIKGDVSEEIAELKQQPGHDLLIYGSGDLVRTLMQHDLIDEYRLWVSPVVVGGGKRLFQDGTARTVLSLVGRRTFSSGVIVLSYQPTRKAGAGAVQPRTAAERA